MAHTQTFGFGARLKQARVEAKITQTELAEIAGENGDKASKQAVSGWEAERHYPKANQLRAICLKLRISPDDLLLGDIKDSLNFLRAESAVKALTSDQREALMRLMNAPPATNERVGQFIQAAPEHELDSGFGGLEPAQPYSGNQIEPHHPARKQTGKGRKEG